MKGRRSVILLAAVLVAAPAAAAPVSRPPGARNCIDSRSVSGQRAENEETLVLSDGLRTYRNHLRTSCPGLLRLNSFGSLETEQQGTQLCEGDRIRVFDPDSVRTVGIQAYPICVLGWFELVPKPPRPPKH